MAKKFKGKLGKKKRSKKPLILAAALRDFGQEEQIETKKLARKIVEEEIDQLHVLGNYYKIDKKQNADAYMLSLCLHLARDFVPGFMEANIPGRKKKWTTEKKNRLVYQIEALISDDNSSHGITWACRLLVKKEPWASMIEEKKDSLWSDKAKTLRQRYYAITKHSDTLSKQ